MKNYYEILGVKSNATFEEIKKAYEKNRYKVKDIYELEEIDEIYHVLSNHNRRIAYNNQLLHHDTVFFDDKNGSVNVSQKEIDEALDKLVSNELVKGIPKPLDRYDFENCVGLSDKEDISPQVYEDYLKNYWEIVKQEKETLEGYIDGTNIAIPMNRDDFEAKLGLNSKANISHKLYEAYLEDYYLRAFAKTEPEKDEEAIIAEKIKEELAKNPRKDEEAIVAEEPEIEQDEEENKPRLVTKILKNKRLKKLITIGFLAGALVLSVLGLKSCKKETDNLPKEPETTSTQDNNDENKDEKKEPEQIADQAINEEQAQSEDKKISVGTNVYLDQGTEFYNSSIDHTLTGYIGNEYTTPGVYTVDKVVVIDNNTNQEIANSTKAPIDINNYNNGNYTVMTHFSNNITKEDIEKNRIENDSSKNIGWVNANNLAKDKISGNILEDDAKTR